MKSKIFFKKVIVTILGVLVFIFLEIVVQGKEIDAWTLLTPLILMIIFSSLVKFTEVGSKK